MMHLFSLPVIFQSLHPGPRRRPFELERQRSGLWWAVFRTTAHSLVRRLYLKQGTCQWAERVGAVSQEKGGQGITKPLGLVAFRRRVEGPKARGQSAGL